jgi:hypothetical protein
MLSKYMTDLRKYNSFQKFKQLKEYEKMIQSIFYKTIIYNLSKNKTNFFRRNK